MGLWLLGLAAPIWLIAWLPLRLRYFTRFPEKGLPPFLAVVVIGGLGGIIELWALMYFLGHTYYAGQPPPPMVYFVAFVVAGSVGAGGGASIWLAEILISRWGRKRVKVGEATLRLF